MPNDDPLADVLAFSQEFAQAMWLSHAPSYPVPLRDVRERDAQNPHDPNGRPGDNWSREPHRRWQENEAVSDRVIFPFGVPVAYSSAGSWLPASGADGRRWQFGSWQALGGRDCIFRSAVSAERMAELRKLGSWLTDNGRLRVHCDEQGLWSEPNPDRTA